MSNALKELKNWSKILATSLICLSQGWGVFSFNYRHKEELVEWTQHIHESDATQVWAYFNNDRDGYAIKNARALIRLLAKKAYAHAQ